MIMIKRFCYHPMGILGVLWVAGRKFYTVERPWKDNIPYESCIPEGEYDLSWRESPKFGWTYEVKDVPNRTHILIHVANYPQDVVGCVGLGSRLMADRIAVFASKLAINEFHEITGANPWQLHIEYAKNAALESMSANTTS